MVIDLCGQPWQHSDSCLFVQQSACSNLGSLVNYLKLRYCIFPHFPGVFLFFLAVILLLCISLLATTAEYFFVPQLDDLSKKLQLSPSLSGITLLAIGNGAPDIFTAVSGLGVGDSDIVVGEMVGGALLITTFVLGVVLVVGSGTQVSSTEFYRDVVVFSIVAGSVAFISFVQFVTFIESIVFVLSYIVYVIIVLLWPQQHSSSRSNAIPLVGSGTYADDSCSVLVSTCSNVNSNPSIPLPAGVHIFSDNGILPKPPLYGVSFTHWNQLTVSCRVQFILELPFSVLRWISIPLGDTQWCEVRRACCVISPFFFFPLVLTTLFHWSWISHLSVLTTPGLFAFCLSLSWIMFTSTSSTKALCAHQKLFLSLCSYCGSIMWLHLLANEVVAIAQAIGIILNINSGLLGMTILAVGNSIGDLVTNSAVARSGNGAAAVTACFAAPILSHSLGLGFAFAFHSIKVYPARFYLGVDLVSLLPGWIFLLVSLVSSLLAFPLSRFQPGYTYGYTLIAFYFVFTSVSIALSIMD